MEHRMEDAVERLKEAGIRITIQRQLILEYLYAKLSHPTADEVYSAIYADYPKYVSPTTVYNNLRKLKKLGLVREFHLPETGISRYDTNTEPHTHLYCTSCGNISDWDAGAPEASTAADGLRSDDAYAQISGVCHACKTELN